LEQAGAVAQVREHWAVEATALAAPNVQLGTMKMEAREALQIRAAVLAVPIAQPSVAQTRQWRRHQLLTRQPRR